MREIIQFPFVSMETVKTGKDGVADANGRRGGCHKKY